MASWQEEKRTIRIALLVLVLAAIVVITRVCAEPRPGGSSATLAATSTVAPPTTASTITPHTTVTSLPTGTAPATNLTPSVSEVAAPPSPLTHSDIIPSTEASGSAKVPAGTKAARVLEVIDGDTFWALVSGSGKESVRLIGIDAPESGEPFSDEARLELAQLLSDATPQLETDVEERDQYGRLLAYVWVGELFVNAELLRRGVATLYTIPPNLKHVDQLRAAQDQAQAAARGMWGAPGQSPVKIVQVNYNAPGDDNLNLNKEYVVFEALVSGTLLGYSVQDEAGHRYRFPDIVFRKGDVFKLHSGTGTDTRTDLYWGAAGSAIWNNSGDTVKVVNPQGRIVESYSY